MQIKDLFLAQLDRETAITRRMLERVPEGKPDWKPHEKSMPLSYLSALVATMPSWIESIVNDPELDIAPKDGSQYSPRSFAGTKALLEGFEAAVARGRKALANTTDDHLMTTWRLLVAGNKVAEDPRHQVVSDTFTHWAHHRGQLSVYLRLNDVPLASIYGPTADEKGFQQGA
jgi:uncharacterized damage-inducible protein DinB